MKTLFEHLENILSPDLATLAVLAALCAIAAYFVKEYLANPTMIVFVFPVMLVCALVAYYLFASTDQFNPKKMDQWLMWAILASICGAVVGIGVASMLAALRERLGIRTAPTVKPTRIVR